jgi:hypothetical protein
MIETPFSRQSLQDTFPLRHGRTLLKSLSQPAHHLAFTSVEEVVEAAAVWVRLYEKSASTSLAPKALYRPFTIEPPNLRAKS